MSEPGFFTPAHRHAQVLGLDHHEHAARRRAPRPSASAICVVSRSCTCGRLAKPSTRRAIFDSPVMRPSSPGMYATCARPANGTRWCSHIAVQRDVAHHDHLVVVGLERDREVLRRVLVQPGEDLVVHRRRCASGVRTSPSRSGSSPIASRISRTARSIRVVVDGRRRLAGTRVQRTGVGHAEPPGAAGRSDCVAAAACCGSAPAARRRADACARASDVPSPSHMRTSAKISCTRSASSVSCSISSAASRSRIVAVRRRAPLARRRARRRSSTAHLGVDAGGDLVGVVGRAA